MKAAVPAILAAALLLAAALPGGVSAKDLGVRGATWPVAEPDLLAQIEARLVEMERSGALARLKHEARANARRTLEEPDPAPGIAPATEERSRLFDPAIAVARDIRTADGTLIAAAGTRVNPLERVTLARDLLFVDGRREGKSTGRWRAKTRAGGPRRSCCSPGDRSTSRAGTAGPSSSTRAGVSPRGSESRRRHRWSPRTGRGCASRKSPWTTRRARRLRRATAEYRKRKRMSEKEERTMLNMNRATLLGHAGRDPEIRDLRNGGRAATFTLATTEKWKDGEGNPVEATEWHRVVVYGPAVKAVESMLKKGDRVMVEGRIATRTFSDREGTERNVTEIVVSRRQDTVNMLSARRAPADATAGPRS